MRFKGLLGFILLIPLSLKAQNHPLEIHGLHTGMLAREVILHSQAPVDTMIWGGEDGASIFSFKGEYLRDSGDFRIGLQGTEITQVSFIARERSVEANTKIFNKVYSELKKIYGPPIEDYHNVYRIITWASATEELKLTTADQGKFYSVTLTKRQSKR